MKRHLITILAAVALSGFLINSVVLAQTDQTSEKETTKGKSTTATSQSQQQQQAQQRGVPPLTFDLKASPGEKVKDSIVITNYKQEAMQVQVAVLDFEVTNEEGGIQVTNVVKDEHKLAAWVSFSEPSFLLQKGESKKVDFEIAVPQDAKVGTHWTMLFFQGTNPKGEKTLETVAGSNAFVFLTVKGNGLREEGDTKQFFIQKTKNRDSLNLVLRFSNFGNTILRPKGTITIYNIWGKKVDSVDLTDAIITPNAIGKITTTWKPEKKISFGRYKAVLKGYYGSKNTEFVAKSAVMILPWEIGWAKYVIYTLLGLGFVYLVLRLFKIKITFVRVA